MFLYIYVCCNSHACRLYICVFNYERIISLVTVEIEHSYRIHTSSTFIYYVADILMSDKTACKAMDEYI